MSNNEGFYIPRIKNEDGEVLMIEREAIDTFIQYGDICVAQSIINGKENYNIYYTLPWDEKYGVSVDLEGRLLLIRIKKRLFGGGYKHSISLSDKIIDKVIESGIARWGSDEPVQVFDELEEVKPVMPIPTPEQLDNAYTLIFGKVKI